MTESPSNLDYQEQQVQSFEGFNPSYETLRDEIPGVPHSVREQWQRSDRDVASLRESYTNLQQDSDYTEEARARRAQELYERQKDRIEQRWAQTRKELRDASAAAQRMSVPKPAGQSLEASNSNDILAAQGERDRIIRTLDRHSSRGGPFKPDTASFLKAEYKKGLESKSGVMGAAICREVMAAAEELGVGTEWIDSLRNDAQRKHLDDARRLEQAAFAVPSTAPKPPKSLQKAVDRAQRHDMMRRQRSSAFLTGGSGEPLQASEPSHGARKTKKKRAWK
jgi:hypothetical protein